MEPSEYGNQKEKRKRRNAVPAGIERASDGGFETAAASQASLMDYAQLLLRRKGILLIAAVLGASVGLLVSLPKTPIYQARTSLEIQGVNENLLNTRDINPAAPSGGSTVLEEMQTQVKILQSASLIGTVVNRLGVTGTFTPLSRLAKWRAALGITKISPASAREAAVIMAAQSIQIEPLQNARVIQILCDSTDPKVAAEFLNELANEFINQKLTSRVQISQRTSEWLGQQLDELKVNLENSEEKLQAYALSAGLMFTSEKDGSVAEQNLQQLQAEVSSAQAERVIRQSKYEIAGSAAPETLPQILDDVSLRNLQSRLSELRSQLAELNISLTPEHYRVQRLQAQINELQSAFDGERKNIIKRIANEYDEAKRREDLLLRAHGAQAAVVTDQAGKVAHYGILKREVDTNRQLYEGMMQRVKEYSIASAVAANNVRVIDSAVPPGAPYKPDIFMYTMLALVTGLFLGIVLIVHRERQDRTICEPGEGPSYMKVPEFGVIISADADSTLKPHHSHKRGEKWSLKKSDQEIELLAWEKPSSLFAECFRSTAASLLFSEASGSSPRLAVIASCEPRDGKSTIISNLAVALAETKRRVLVIDADLRRPHLHTIFNVDNRSGLTDILQANIEINEYPLEMMVKETIVRNVYVMTSGTGSNSNVHLLHSIRLPELIRRFQKEFDVVLIDAPPVSQMADARILARLTEGVIFVIRSSGTSRDAAVAACRQFSDDGSRVLGTILNMWNPKDSNQQGYHQYYNSYYKYYAQDLTEHR